MKPVSVGIVGCGKIFPAYVKNLKQYFSRVVDVAVCADINTTFASDRAKEFGIPRSGTVDDLLADRSVELVINLTNPASHHAVTLAALRAGKHVFGEKPLAFTREQGQEMVATAKAKGVTLAGAADTFLGASPQTARRLIDEGVIGVPGIAQAMIGLSGRTEQGLMVYGGPLFDMAPYYITALVALLGPVKRVASIALTSPAPQEPPPKLAFSFRPPYSTATTLLFEKDVLGTFLGSTETNGYFPRVELFGSKCRLKLNDANAYGGAITTAEWSEEKPVTLDAGFSEAGRGLGVAEQAYAIRAGRAPRAGAELTYHVFDVQHTILESSNTGKQLNVASTCARPEPFDLRALTEG